MAQRQAVREMRLVFETESGRQFVMSDNHMMDRIGEALAKVNNVHIAFAFYDTETGVRLRKVELSPCSPEMKKLIDLELNEEELPA